MSKKFKEKLIKIASTSQKELKLISEKEYEKIKSARLEFKEKFLKEENERYPFLKKESLEKLKSRLKIEKISFEVLNKDLIKVKGEENDFLLAISTVGIEGLDFIKKHYERNGFESILNKEMYQLYPPYKKGSIEESFNYVKKESLELTIKPIILEIPKCVKKDVLIPKDIQKLYQDIKGIVEKVYIKNFSLDSIFYKPIILEIPKCVKKDVLIPKDIQKLYQDIKGIVEKVYIKNFSLDSIFYIESSDKYIILDIEEYALLNRNVEIDLEQFLYKGNIYKYKGEPLYFEGHQLLTY